MKYLIGNTAINSDHIVKAKFYPETPDDVDPEDRPAICEITLIDDGEVRLRGKKAEWFGEAYSSDAYCVITEKQAQS